jgi:cation diffusion facilitator family transporter
MDGIGLSIAVLGFALMTKDPSERLPEGFGRLEYLSSFILSVLLIGTGVYFAYSSIDRIFYPYPISFTWLRFAIIAITALAKLLLGFWFKYHNKRINSGVLKTAQFDSWLDFGITIMTLIGFSLTVYTQLRLDGIFGIILSVIIIIGGIKLFKENIIAILGDKIDDETTNKIYEKIIRHTYISQVENIKIYDYGIGRRTALVTVEFELGVDLNTIKTVIDEITAEIQNLFELEIKICIKGGRDERDKDKTPQKTEG